jgi:HPt (histidine-containing phosphotransfer) domain-containing protein
MLIDWVRVRDLHDEIGSESFAEVVELFLAEIGSAMDRLAEAADVSTLEQDLHFIKGGALNLGFDALSALCHQAERDAATGADPSPGLPAIIDCHDQSRREFLGGMAAALNRSAA